MLTAGMGMVCTGMWGLVFVLRKRGKERLSALVTVAVGVIIQLFVELFRLRGFI
jgi:hypothetical protein